MNNDNLNNITQNNNDLFEDIFSGLVTPFSTSSNDNAFIPISSFNTYDYPLVDGSDTQNNNSNDDFSSLVLFYINSLICLQYLHQMIIL